MNLIDALRLKEIIGKSGFFMIGMIFSQPQISLGNFIIAIQFFFICVLNGIAIYLINAGLGYDEDRQNSRLSNLHSLNKKTVLISGGVLLVGSLALLYLFSSNLLLPALLIYFIWTLYSIPKGFKGIPLLGLVSAFIAQVLHFHIGYLVFNDWSNSSILISIYFALLFSSGHALHEVIDYAADRNAGLKTSAVYFGKNSIGRFSNYIFVCSAFYIGCLGYFSIIPMQITFLYSIAFILQQLFFRSLKDFNSEEDIFSYRRKYMTAYLMATGAVTLMLYLKLV